uniref:Uncharacterized protein n=1 Tax=Anguilla anguilla TaxID=7936 RepID=A0A0E9QGR0_ANGAN
MEMDCKKKNGHSHVVFKLRDMQLVQTCKTTSHSQDLCSGEIKRSVASFFTMTGLYFSFSFKAP